MKKIKQFLMTYNPELTGINLLACVALLFMLMFGLYRQAHVVEASEEISNRQDTLLLNQKTMISRDVEADSAAASLVAQLDSINKQ